MEKHRKLRVVGALLASVSLIAQAQDGVVDQKAHVTVYRPRINWASAMFHEPVVFDGQVLLKLCDGCRYDFDVDPGSHTIQARSAKSKHGVNPTFEAGKHYFYVMTAQNMDMVIIPVAEEQAKFELANVKPADRQARKP